MLDTVIRYIDCINNKISSSRFQLGNEFRKLFSF